LKKIFLFLLAIIVLLIIIISVNTVLFKSKQSAPVGQRRTFPIDTSAIIHLSAAIRYQTISYDFPENETTMEDSLKEYFQKFKKFIPGWHAEIAEPFDQFDSLLQYLNITYPLTFKNLLFKNINERSVLLHWKGTSKEKKPVIFYAHLDVVPAYNENDTSLWKHEPFSGENDGEFIHGRGAIDDKGSIIAMMEATEKLLANNFTPSRDIYFAFGHDEEAGGKQGAYKIAEELEREGVKAEFLLDEGGLVAIDMVPFVKSPVALVFTSEKGYMSLNLSVKGKGGHSSYPPTDPPVEILSKAILKIHEHPFKQRMTEPVSEFMDYAGPEMRFPFKSLFANRWLFKPVIFNEYEKISTANAMLRTTSVATKINGGIKENVIPSEVYATINFRLLPGDKSEDVIESLKKIIDDERVSVRLIKEAEEASEVSSTNSPGFKILQSSINKVFPDAIVAPSLLIAQTDSRHFSKVTANVFRFLPVRMTNEILDGMHGRDEKIGIPEFMESIEFYKTLLSDL